MFETQVRYFIFIPSAALIFEDGNREELMGRILCSFYDAQGGPPGSYRPA